jgi:hypothetical protein
MLIYQIEKNLSIDEFIEVLVNSTLAKEDQLTNQTELQKCWNMQT